MKTKIVAVISNPKRVKKDAILSKRHGADILELRFDLLYPHIADSSRLVSLVKSVRKTVNLPIIGTIRLKSEGGEYSGKEKVRSHMFSQIIPELDYIDIELRSIIANKVVNLAKKNKKKIIVSYHNFSNTPNFSNLKKIVNRGKKLSPDIIKIATYINKPDDFLNLTRILSNQKHNKCTIAIIPMSRENSFMPLRLISLFLHSTLGYFSAAKSVAPGQLTIKQYWQLTR